MIEEKLAKLNKYYKKTKDTKEYDNMLVKTLNIL